MLDTFVEFILAQDPFLVIVLLMLLSALENIFPPVPADVAAALGAFWAVRTGHSPIWVGFLCFAANQASAIAVYYWVRARGEAVLRSAVFRSLMSEDVQPLIERNIDRFGGLGVFVSRFLPGLRAAVLPFAAIHGLTPARTLWPAAAASFVWYAALTVAGSALGLAYDEVKATVAAVTGALGVVGLTLAAMGIFLLWRAGKRARARRRAERTEHDAGD
jgi:membrane protein DedA with SNARE-associated domain